jgi:hypothetical protein
MTIETLESEFAEALTTIASGLGIAAERIFGIFVSAQVLIGILNIVSVLLIIGGAYIGGIYTKKWCVESGTSPQDSMCIRWMVSFIAACILWIITDALSSAILKICCPEYTAMKEIIMLVIP